MPVFCCGWIAVQFKGPLWNSVFPFGWKGCNLKGTVLSCLSVKSQYKTSIISYLVLYMLSLLWPSLAKTCTKNTKLTFYLHGICHTVFVFTVESGQPTTSNYGGRLPSGHETHHPTGTSAPHIIR
jgi:hypothetical protein